ncbi:MAG: hypothetical protein LBE95_02285 [Holosporaceae bacterium]|jgi:hypothetical protein|nr:hypothetical protein [Holosporaceae bacterium]
MTDNRCDTNNFRKFVLSVAILFFQQAVYADVGVPTIMLFEPFMILLLIPVIFVEFMIMKRYLQSLPKLKVLKATAISNVCSTLIDFPVTWIMMLIMQFLYSTLLKSALDFFKVEWKKQMQIRYFLEPAWSAPHEHPTNIQMFGIGISLTIMLIASFFMSYWIEHKITSKICKEADVSVIKKSVWQANIASYILLFVSGIVCLIFMRNR